MWKLSWIQKQQQQQKINKHFSLLHVGTFVFHSVYYQFKHICCQQIRSMTLLIKHLNAKRWQQVQESHFDGRYDNCCCLNGKLWLMWFFFFYHECIDSIDVFYILCPARRTEILIVNKILRLSLFVVHKNCN